MAQLSSINKKKKSGGFFFSEHQWYSHGLQFLIKTQSHVLALLRFAPFHLTRTNMSTSVSITSYNPVSNSLDYLPVNSDCHG